MRGRKIIPLSLIQSSRKYVPPQELGLLWNRPNDHFKSRTTPDWCKQQNTASTKRKVLVPTAKIGEPFELLSSVVIAYKIFLPKFWQVKCLCDELLSAHLQQKRNQLLLTIPKL